MRRKYNYTGRKRITADRVDIVLSRDPINGASFDASINLDGLNLPENAEVVVESYYRRAYMRFPFGHVGQMLEPVDRGLTQFAPDSPVLFRVKVVDESGEIGKLLAVADKLKPEEAESGRNRHSIIHVQAAELHHEIWRLEIGEAIQMPTLHVNKALLEEAGLSVEDLVLRDRKFRSLVYPAIVRQILHYILIEHNMGLEFEDDNDWKAKWMRFSIGFASYPLEYEMEMDVDELESWINDVVNGFCKQLELKEAYLSQLKQDDE